MGTHSRIRGAGAFCVAGLWGFGLCASVSAQDADLFANRITLAAGNGVIYADVTGDGIEDAVGRQIQQIFVSAGDGFGGFHPHVAYGSPAIGHTLQDHVLGDFNSDGALDVAASKFPTDTIEVRFNDGAGAFGDADVLPMEHLPNHIESADFDGDGHLDLVVSSSYPHLLSILFGDGAGSFSAPVSYPSFKDPYEFVVRDMDHDGALDVVMGGRPPDGLALFKGDGLGGFLPMSLLTDAGYYPNPQVADINGDQQLDIFAVNKATSSGDQQLSVLFGDGLGAFPTRVDTVLLPDSTAAALGHLDNDGELDAVITTSFSINDRKLYSMLGDGSGSFSFASEFFAGTGGGQVLIEDRDLDGNADVIREAGGGLAVLHGDGLGGVDQAPIYPTSYLAGALVSADVDLDGQPDLILSSDGVVELRFGMANGSFAPPQAVPVSVAGFSDIAVGDLDGDTWPDLALLKPNTFVPSLIHVLLADGQGGFTEVLPVRVGRASFDVEIADVNGDGFMDLLASNAKDDTLSLIHGDGTGHFGDGRKFATGKWPIAVRAADLNEDGRLDLISADDVEHTLTVHLSTGAGEDFQAPLALGAVVAAGGTVLVEDLNDDGHLDLTSGAGNIGVHLGDGSGNFSYVDSGHNFGDAAKDVIAFDVDGDLHKDLVLVHYFQDLFVVLRGDGAGGFDVQSNYIAGSAPTDIVWGDFNGDSRIDVVVCNSESGDLTVHFNRAPWTNLGQGLGGVAGIPKLGGDGILMPGSPGSLALRKAAPSAMALLFGALSSAPTPFKGGTLVPFPFVLARSLLTDASGEAAANWATLPAGVPSGLTLYFQAAVLDANAPFGVALSNAMRAVIP